MGESLTELFRDTNHTIAITSRKNLKSYDNIHYIKGNAKNISFVKNLLVEKYDIIIDFMSYSTEEFRQRYQLYLSNTWQYVFISSARVYAESDIPITENTARLLDTSSDKKYLSTDEYALAKARSEDLLKASNLNNYTIIRPSITYGKDRLQLGVLEKENWLYRVLHGRSIVFSKDISGKYTTMTSSMDVAKGIFSILGKKEALGQVFHITSEKAYTWNEILNLYVSIIERELGIPIDIVMTEKAVNLKLKAKQYQVIYCRYFNRRFDNSKIKKHIDVDNFTDPKDGLDECLSNFLRNPVFKEINWVLEAWNDKMAHERTPLKEIPSLKQKIAYMLCRYHLTFFINFYEILFGRRKF